MIKDIEAKEIKKYNDLPNYIKFSPADFGGFMVTLFHMGLFLGLGLTIKGILLTLFFVILSILCFIGMLYFYARGNKNV